MITAQNINANRLGHNREWESSWVTDDEIYKLYLHNDYLILRLIEVILMKYTTPVTNREKPRNIKGEGKNKSAKKNIINSPFVELQAWLSHATIYRNPQLIIKIYYRDILLERWRQRLNYRARKISSYFIRKRSGRKIQLLRTVPHRLRKFEKIHPKAKKNRKRRKKQLLHVNPLRVRAKKLKQVSGNLDKKAKRAAKAKKNSYKNKWRQKNLGIKKVFFARRLSRTIVRNTFRRKYRFKYIVIGINGAFGPRMQKIRYKLKNKRKYVKITRLKQPFTIYKAKKFLEAHYKRRQKKNPNKNYQENLRKVALLGTYARGFQISGIINPEKKDFTKPTRFFGYAPKFRKVLYTKKYFVGEKSSVILKLQTTIINKIKFKLKEDIAVKQQRKLDFKIDELNIARILCIVQLLFRRVLKRVKNKFYFFYRTLKTESAKLKRVQKKGFVPTKRDNKKIRISFRGLRLPQKVKLLRIQIRKMKKGPKRDKLRRKLRRQVKILRIIKLDNEQTKHLPQVIVFDHMPSKRRNLRQFLENTKFLPSRKFKHFPLFIFDALIKNRLNRIFLFGKNIFRNLLSGIVLLPSIFKANSKKLLWFLFFFKSALLALFNFPFFKPSLKLLSLLNLMFVKEHQFQHTQKHAFRKILHARFLFLQVLNATIVCSVRTFDKTKAIGVSFFGLHERNVSARFLSNFLALKLSQYFTMQEAIRPVIFDLKRNRALEAFRFIVAGRLTRKERAAYSVKQHGNLTLGTKDVFIDYSLNHKIMRFGIVGLKVNINLNLRKVNPVNYVMRFKPNYFQKRFMTLLNGEVEKITEKILKSTTNSISTSTTGTTGTTNTGNTGNTGTTGTPFTLPKDNFNKSLNKESAELPNIKFKKLDLPQPKDKPNIIKSIRESSFTIKPEGFLRVSNSNTFWEDYKINSEKEKQEFLHLKSFDNNSYRNTLNVEHSEKPKETSQEVSFEKPKNSSQDSFEKPKNSPEDSKQNYPWFQELLNSQKTNEEQLKLTKEGIKLNRMQVALALGSIMIGTGLYKYLSDLLTKENQDNKAVSHDAILKAGIKIKILEQDIQVILEKKHNIQQLLSENKKKTNFFGQLTEDAKSNEIKYNNQLSILTKQQENIINVMREISASLENKENNINQK